MSRCWPGYEPVPGKQANEEGSCRPKAKSRLSPKERAVRERRKKQLDRQKRAGVSAKERSARRHATPAPKGVSAAHRRKRTKR
jgi:hypothetical protein